MAVPSITVSSPKTTSESPTTRAAKSPIEWDHYYSSPRFSENRDIEMHRPEDYENDGIYDAEDDNLDENFVYGRLSPVPAPRQRTRTLSDINGYLPGYRFVGNRDVEMGEADVEYESSFHEFTFEHPFRHVDEFEGFSGCWGDREYEADVSEAGYDAEDEESGADVSSEDDDGSEDDDTYRDVPEFSVCDSPAGFQGNDSGYYASTDYEEPADDLSGYDPEVSSLGNAAGHYSSGRGDNDMAVEEAVYTIPRILSDMQDTNWGPRKRRFDEYEEVEIEEDGFEEGEFEEGEFDDVQLEKPKREVGDDDSTPSDDEMCMEHMLDCGVCSDLYFNSTDAPQDDEYALEDYAPQDNDVEFEEFPRMLQAIPELDEPNSSLPYGYADHAPGDTYVDGGFGVEDDFYPDEAGPVVDDEGC
ncbi:uncharacterized protein BKA55DRAFT_728360 [Fusarium redolens]|uniref:Transcription factor Iwr1 domain-containing protein n=1 Tax=Fusarium redolens TaxID=48865 RepID=A0A9P9H3B5_FUSRE|nr:uncharacterized protein BKA55DRAFT_728360 [Fusarium redolens]KAH7250261.1 hypothetical protein BKA55DRAFT_728360 [Fusarium redolens]